MCMIKCARYRDIKKKHMIKETLSKTNLEILRLSKNYLKEI